jgi:hypothetical protein
MVNINSVVQYLQTNVHLIATLNLLMPRHFGLYLTCFARDFKAQPPYSAAASPFVMKPPPAIFCSQVDLQVARQSYLSQISHIQVSWRRRGLPAS